MAQLPLNDTPEEVKKDPLARKLAKIKRNGNEWSFVWYTGTSKHAFNDTQQPTPDLVNEFDKVLSYAVQAAPWLSSEYHKKTYVSEIKFDWKGDVERRNAIVTIGVTGKPIYINTDKRLAENGRAEAKVARWDQNAVAQFDKMELQAFGYIDGERAQPEVPLIAREKPTPEQESFINDELQDTAA